MSHLGAFKTFLAILVLVFFVPVLSGCSSKTVTPVAPVPSNITTDKAKETSSSMPVEAGIIGSSVQETCDTLISIEDLYNFNPNYALDSSRSPESGSLAKLATDYKGISCTYVNLSSGDSVTVSLAHFDDQSFTKVSEQREKESRPATSDLIPLGFTAHFSSNTAGGTLEVLGNNYWLTASSTWAQSADELLKLVSNSLNKLSM